MHMREQGNGGTSKQKTKQARDKGDVRQGRREMIGTRDELTRYKDGVRRGGLVA